MTHLVTNNYNKHLSQEERLYIEYALNRNINLNTISNTIKKDPRGVSKEIKRNRYIKYPTSFNNHKPSEECSLLKRFPFCCNGCDKKNCCRKIKYYYSTIIAQQKYKTLLVESRIGYNISEDEIHKLDNLISPLVKQGQSLNHIFSNHSDEIPVSKASLYSYINLGLLSIKNIDLPRKVSYKPRKKDEKTRKYKDRTIRLNRTFKDFLYYTSQHIEDSIVEMDTVEGIKGGKVLLTLTFRKYRMLFAFLLDNKDSYSVLKVFDYLQNLYGLILFKKLFAIILTDNGSEFSDPLSLEFDSNGEERCHIFFCDPSASWQKGICEKNHEFIRYVVPKGTSFNNFVQEQINLLTSHINSYSRDILNNLSPYQAFCSFEDETILKKMGIIQVDHDKVTLKPNLFKK